MNYKEAVKEKIKEEDCKKLWEEIATAYEKGGEEEIKTVLSKKVDEINNNFERLLRLLEEKL